MNYRRYSKFLTGLCTSLILLSMMGTSAMAAAGDTTRVSVASDGTQGNGSVWGGALSGNGRYIAFGSNASNLVSNDTNNTYDFFVHDLFTRETERVSVASDGNQGNNASVNAIDISDDGRYVAFSSYASNLVPNDMNNTQDVFVRDRLIGETYLISVDSNGIQGNSDSGFSKVSISDDGRYVAFYSLASNLVSNDTNNKDDVFIHDRQTGQTRRISLASDGTQGNNHSFVTDMSSDARFVLFYSYATNLVSEDTNGYIDTFMYDTQTSQTTRVSVGTGGIQGNGDSYGGSISDDG